MSEVCRVEDVYKAYGKTEVLRGVSFKMDAAERVGLMGPSGSGKSTLLNCLSGIDTPDAGRVSMAGLDLFNSSSREIAELRRTDVSTVFQFFHLLPTLTAHENIEMSLQLAGIKSSERQERVEEVLDAVELGHRATAFPETLSGGEQQRVAIARALVHGPNVILADEPTGNLDSHAGMNILTLLDQLAERYQIAMLIVTHSEEVTRICGRVLHMRDGQLV